VSESEHAGVFCNGQVGVDERIILSSLGHPQPTTIIYCDNECAKKSKSIDVRFDWTQDRVRQNNSKWYLLVVV
jgi:hypothetical protein